MVEEEGGRERRREGRRPGRSHGPERGGGSTGDRGGSGPPDLPPAETPWVETRAGGLFFVNAVLVSPELVVLFPLVVGAVLRSLGLLQGTSRFIDTIPQMAAYVLPWTGWIFVIPLWSTVKNLRMEGVGYRARRALWGMASLHLLFLAYTVWRWLAG